MFGLLQKGEADQPEQRLEFNQDFCTAFEF
jgi:hypothetical protein